jgi:hypothetical protein
LRGCPTQPPRYNWYWAHGHEHAEEQQNVWEYET